MEKDESTIATLVTAAAGGDADAWHQIVVRYAPLLIAVCRRYRLTTAELEDVAQTVWLRLVEHLEDLREPRALPMWISTTAKRECLRHLATERRAVPHDPLEGGWQESVSTTADLDANLVRAERKQALLAGLAELPDTQRRLLLLLATDPPLSYAQISSTIGLAVGSIGPIRARALERLRATPSVKALMNDSPLNPDRTPGGDRRDSAPLG
jgi:RNA polymerase sigma factor (sigma-70 family)